MLKVLFFFLFIQGFVQSQEDLEDFDLSVEDYERFEDFVKFEGCNRLLSGQVQKKPDNHIPDADEMLARCPVAKDFIDCRIKHFKPQIDPVHNLGDYIANKRFLNEICDVNSNLHKAYVEHLDCFRSIVDKWEKCSDAASDVVRDFEKSSYAVQNDDIEELDEEQREEIEAYRALAQTRCLTNAHVIFCIGSNILETCGFDAFNTYVEIFDGVRFANHFCGKDDNPSLEGFVKYLASEDKHADSTMIKIMFDVDDD